MYQVVYQEKQSNPNRKEVIVCYDVGDSVKVQTGQANLVGSMDEIVSALISQGVDISFLWKNGFIERIVPTANVQEISISDCPMDSNYKRKAFRYGLFIQDTNEQAWFNVIVRHFLNDVHNTETFEDMFFSFVINETTQQTYDYFRGVINSGVNLFDLQDQQILTLDQDNRFNEGY